jgi:hypothetical protein
MLNGMESKSFVGRIPAVLFAVICAIAAIFGACLAFVVAAASFGIAEAIFGPQLRWLEAPTALIAVLAGLFLPVYWLIARRRKQRPQIEPRLSTPPRREAEAPPAARGYELITDVPSSVVTSPAAPQRMQLPTTVKWILGATSALVALVIIVALLSGDNLELQVTSSRSPSGILRVTNTGSSPTTILDVIINDRMECSIIDDYHIIHYGKLDETLTNDDWHKIWVYRPGYPYGSAGTPAAFSAFRKSLRPVELKVGDTANWFTRCNSIVRATITTNKGSASYSFSR